MPNGAGGGGGGGIVGVGNTFTGPAEALEIMGDHAYALSGEFTADTTSREMLSFTSGNFYLVGEITTTGAIKLGEPANGFATVYSLFFNGIQVMAMKYDAKEEDAPALGTIPILIPPYTEVSLQAASATSASEFLHLAQIVGRIYRG